MYIFRDAIANWRIPCALIQHSRRSLHSGNPEDANKRIVAYAKTGHLAEARIVFETMPRRDVVSWNSIIWAYAKNGQGQEALLLFDRMGWDGPCPDYVTFLGTLTACAILKSLHKAKTTHACLSRFAITPGYALASALISMYGKCGSPDTAKRVHDGTPHKDLVCTTAMVVAYAQNGQIEPARKLFDKIVHRDTVLFNAMIAAYAQYGHAQNAIELFLLMICEGVSPDKVSYIGVLDACACSEALEQGKLIHASIACNGVEVNTIMGTALVNMYGKCRRREQAKQIFDMMPNRDTVTWTVMITALAQNGRLEDAQTIFDKMPHRDVVAWNAIIAAYAQNGNGKRALELFHQMEVKYRVKPNRVTFVSVLDACACLSALDQGKAIHSRIRRTGNGPDVVVNNALIHMYGKCGSPEEARCVFDEMTQRDTISWNAIITAYARNGQAKQAIEMLQRIDSEGKPDRISFISILSACSHAGLLDEGHKCFISAYRYYSMVLTVEHYMCMIDLLGRAGQMEEAEEMLTSLPWEPPFSLLAAACKCLLSACRVHGDVERGVRASEHLSQLDPNNSIPNAQLSNKVFPFQTPPLEKRIITVGNHLSKKKKMPCLLQYSQTKCFFSNSPLE